MIAFVLKVVVFSGMLAALGWGAALLGREDLVSRELAALRPAFREGSAVEDLLGRSERVSRAVARELPPLLPSGARGKTIDAVRIASVHAEILSASLPVLAAAIGAAVALGLARRERLRSGESFASPTVAYLGKHLAVAGAVSLASYALVPWPLPPAALWWGGGGAATGAFLFVSNLPLKV
jgi:hypothetical protein